MADKQTLTLPWWRPIKLDRYVPHDIEERIVERSRRRNEAINGRTRRKEKQETGTQLINHSVELLSLMMSQGDSTDRSARHT